MKQVDKSLDRGYFENKIKKRREIVESFQKKAKDKRSTADVLADILTSAFGTIAFLVFNFLFFLIWILINTNTIPSINAFDPFPFGFLTMIVSLEAIFLSIIVLISQNRESKVSQLTDTMDMNLDLITEQEITKTLQLLVAIAEKNNIDTSKDKVLQEMLKKLDIDPIEQALREEML